MCPKTAKSCPKSYEAEQTSDRKEMKGTCVGQSFSAITCSEVTMKLKNLELFVTAVYCTACFNAVSTKLKLDHTNPLLA